MPSSNRSVIKVVLANKYALWRTGIKKALEAKEDIQFIGEAENGKQLLHILEHINPDVIVMDVTLPEISGIEALPVIKIRYPGIKVIIHSMHDDISLIIKMMELGANAYLTMNSGADEIYAAIQKCHTNGLYIINLLKMNLPAAKEELIKGFNSKEVEILKLVAARKTTDEISKTVDLSIRTTEAIVKKLMAKSGTASLEELIKYGKENGIL